jgi:mitofusin
MSFADDPVSIREVALTNSDEGNHEAGANGPCEATPSTVVTRKSLKRSVTFAPTVLDNMAPTTDEMADFSILRLDLSLGHGPTSTMTRAGTIMSSLERSSISRLLSSRLESSLSHLKNLEGRVMSTNSRVLVTGDLNAGKSTFVNALLRRGGVDEEGWPTGVLPVDQQPLTGRFVEVFGDQFLGGDDHRERVHIVKGKEEDYDPEDELTYEERKLQDLIDLVAEQEAEAPPLKIYLRAPDQNIANPSILHNGILDISLIDAPGLNRDVIATTSNFTRNPTIDVIIFVVSAFNHFTLSAKEFILSAGQEKARMFIVVNRFDEVRDKEKCKRVVLEQIRQLSPKTWEERDELVHFVDSAQVALRCSEGADENDEKATELDAAFRKLESSLRSFVLVNRAKSKLGPAENYLCHLLADVGLLASANSIVAEEARDKARQEMERVRPGLEAMLEGSVGLEEALGEEEEAVGGTVAKVVKRNLTEALEAVGRGQTAVGSHVSLPPYPGFLGVWDYAIEVRKALLRSVEAAVMQLEDETRKITSNSINTVSELGDRHLPSDVERSKRIFNPQAMFAGNGAPSGRSMPKRSMSQISAVGLNLVGRSELASVSLADVFDLNHYVLAAKSTLTGGKASDDETHGEVTILGAASIAAGAVGIFGGKALGLRHALESVVSVSEILGDQAARRWAAPVAGAVVLGLAWYVVQDLPTAIPRNVGRHIQAMLASNEAAMLVGDVGSNTYAELQSARLQREARKVVRLASWDLRERFRAALEEKNNIVKQSEEDEKHAGQALEYFVGIHSRVDDIKKDMGESVLA